MEKFVLLKLKINGIKGIEKDLNFNFTNNVLNKSFDNSNSHVKAIYGSNGAGKTAVIYAMRMFKQLIQTKDYISLANLDGTFKKIINQNTNRFFIEITFAKVSEESEIKNIYIQEFVLEKKNKDQYYYLSHESLKKQMGLNLSKTDRTKLIYKIEDNNLILNCDDKDKNLIASCFVNLLGTTSFYQILMNSSERIRGKVNSEQFFEAINCLLSFSINITVLLNDNDKDYISSSNFLNIITNISQIKKEDDKLYDVLLQRNKIPSGDEDLILVDDLNAYEARINGILKFLKVFKSDLKKIEIEKKIDGEFYHCRNILIYNDGRKIDKQFESVGVKKLIDYYDAFCKLERGKIVFIDEFDANIHDVLLTKLIEYITYYTEGQFIFTTHNLNPMNVLKKQKHSIDFISNDECVISWISNGNYDPASLYSKGLIDKSPFNMSASDFIGVFENSEY